MKPLQLKIALLTALAFLPSPTFADASPTSDPFAFFEGVTETVGTLKVVMRTPVRTHCLSRGELRRDGSLSFVQRVDDEGTRPYLRRWLVKRIAPGHFVGTMSQATGPVVIDAVGNRYRFHFSMTGGLSVDEWITLLPGGRSATSTTTVRKFGIAVASSDAIVRKIS